MCVGRGRGMGRKRAQFSITIVTIKMIILETDQSRNIHMFHIYFVLLCYNFFIVKCFSVTVYIKYYFVLVSGVRPSG